MRHKAYTQHHESLVRVDRIPGQKISEMMYVDESSKKQTQETRKKRQNLKETLPHSQQHQTLSQGEYQADGPLNDPCFFRDTLLENEGNMRLIPCSSPRTDASSDACRMWQQGKCKRGGKCRFRHQEEREESTFHDVDTISAEKQMNVIQATCSDALGAPLDVDSPPKAVRRHVYTDVPDSHSSRIATCASNTPLNYDPYMEFLRNRWAAYCNSKQVDTTEKLGAVSIEPWPTAPTIRVEASIPSLAKKVCSSRGTAKAKKSPRSPNFAKMMNRVAIF